jgi:hypothetical protein
MVDEHREAYTSKGSNQQAKHELTTLIVRLLKEAGGRILKRVAVDNGVDDAVGDESTNATATNAAPTTRTAENTECSLPVSLWYEVDSETARLKVSHLFRSKPRQTKTKVEGPPTTGKLNTK